jgi:hypothetical protein
VARNLFGSAATSARDVQVRLRPAAPPPAAIIDVFEASALVVRPGQEVALNWRTRDATRVELQPFGTVNFEGRRNHAPSSTTTYTLTAYNRANVPETRSVEVQVKEETLSSPTELSFSVLSPSRKNKVGATVVRVEKELIVFQFRGENAAELRIDGLNGSAKLEDESGQKSALLMGVGQYVFRLVAKNADGRVFRSDPIQVEATCSVSWFNKAMTAGLAGCKKPPEVQWK